MASAPRRGYGALPWDHGRALEVEAELASWLGREFTGKILWTGAGPSIRELFKLKFPMNVFSTPDIVFVPEYFRDDKIIGWGEPCAFDVTERSKYSWREGFPTIYAQVSKVDDLVRFGKKMSFLAYKWADGIWTFAWVEDIASLKLRPKLVDTEVGGEKVQQRVYSIPREWWHTKEEFKALVLEEIKNSEPIDYVKLLGEINRAREDDMKEHVGLLVDAFGKKRFHEIAKYYLAMQPMIEWNPKRELEPSIYILQRVLESMFGKKRPRRKR